MKVGRFIGKVKKFGIGWCIPHRMAADNAAPYRVKQGYLGLISAIIMARVQCVTKIFISFLRTLGDIMNLFKSFYFLFDND